MRGVGGIFSDHLSGDDGVTWQRCVDFVGEAVSGFIDAVTPIVRRRSTNPYDERERQWQLLRRGRYVEFNLVCDRGTRFGLQTGGNIEAILMSMPATAGWAFDVRPEPDSPEGRTSRYLQPRDWAAWRPGPDGAPAGGSEPSADR
jgi:coproporphyrinogen III oxidase